jgi:hypothetical protein
MDTTIEASVARDVEQKLARLVIRSPKLAELPITPLFGVEDLVRLELALGRFAEIHRSRPSKRLVDAVRSILAAARGRLRVANAVRQGAGATEARPR